MIGRDFFDTFAPEDQRAQRRAFFASSLRSGSGATARMTDFVRRDGSVRQFSLTTTVLRDDQGRPTGIAGIGTDVTAQRAVLLDDGAILIDPNYPTPRMVGRAAIREGLRWAFATMAELRFEVVHAFVSSPGDHAGVEVDCHHVLRGGRKLAFSQVFVVDVRDGKLTRLQAYQPNGPGGLVGAYLRVARLGRRLRAAMGRRG